MLELARVAFIVEFRRVGGGGREFLKIDRSVGTKSSSSPKQIVMANDLFICSLVRFKDIDSTICDVDPLIHGVCCGYVPRGTNLKRFHDPVAVESTLNRFDKIPVALLLAIKDIFLFETFTSILE